MRKVSESLWIGNAYDARDLRLVHKCGIRAIVDLAADEAPVAATRDLISLRIPIVDSAENSQEVLSLAIRSTLHFVSLGIPTLVACSHGMSRSPATCAAALALHRGTSLAAEILNVTGTGAADISPPLLRDIQVVMDEVI